jgi:DNA-binding FadR family transcriptional regulator
MPRAENAASRIEHALTVAVLRGEHAPGTRLPTIRELAHSFDVNPATMQRAIARLERSGLVSARQGSGILVHDPNEVGDLSLVPAWLEALADRPERAAVVLADFLEVRRILATRLIVRYRARLRERAHVLRRAAARMEEASREGLVSLGSADLELARVLVRESGNAVAMSVFNTARRVAELPAVAAAMYATPSDNLARVGTVIDAIESELDDASLGALIEGSLTAIDQRTVQRFETALREERR